QACAHCPIFPTAASRRSLDRVSVPVWLIILSDQLRIVALVGRYPANKLIRHRLIQSREALRSSAFTRGSYAVLVPVSLRYPPRKGRFRRIPHPSATRHPGSKLPCAAVRLACVRPAASVHSEPGSNSSLEVFDRPHEEIRQCFECRARSRHQEPLTASLRLNLSCCLLRNICDGNGHHQTPAQVTCAHCQRSPGSASAPAPRPVGLLPEGAAHHTAVLVAVNTSLTSAFLPRPARQPKPVKRAAHYARGRHGGEAPPPAGVGSVQDSMRTTRAKVRFPTCRTPSNPGCSKRWPSSTTSPSIRTARSRSLRFASELLGVSPAAVSAAAIRRPSAGIATSCRGSAAVSPCQRTAAFHPATALSAASKTWKRAASSRANRNLLSRGLSSPASIARRAAAASSMLISKLSRSIHFHIRSSPIFIALVTMSIAGSAMPM